LDDDEDDIPRDPLVAVKRTGRPTLPGRRAAKPWTVTGGRRRQETSKVINAIMQKDEMMRIRGFRQATNVRMRTPVRALLCKVEEVVGGDWG
jgi:hypothetical protein